MLDSLYGLFVVSFWLGTIGFMMSGGIVLSECLGDGYNKGIGIHFIPLIYIVCILCLPLLILVALISMIFLGLKIKWAITDSPYADMSLKERLERWVEK